MRASPLSQVDATLDYVRHLHEELLSTNRELYGRAQLALTIDALVVTVFGAIVSGSPDDAQKTASRLGVVAGGLAFFALTAIAVSIICALVALYVRHMFGRPRRLEGPPRGSQLWFYARIAELEPAAFVEAAAAVTQAEEIAIRLDQITVMTPIMIRRANWVNAAYAAAGTGFIAFVAATATYLVRLAGQ